MTPHQKNLYENRIIVLRKEQFKFEEELKEAVKSHECDIKELRLRTGMSRKTFCEYFGIPYRTVEDWEAKKSTCASYLYELMKEKLAGDGKIIY